MGIPVRRSVFKLRAALAAMLFAAAPAAAQQVMLERDSPLYLEPRLESAQVTQLKQGAAGEVIGKNGAWLNLRTPNATGWLFSFNVRFQTKPGEAAEPAAGGGSALGRLFGPRHNVSVTSAIGVRGIEEEDLKQASFNAGQMSLLDQYAASKESAQDAARAAGLAAERVEYFDAKPK